ncbi:MAG: pilus assembly protein PilM [Planctomycetota bacterium]
MFAGRFSASTGLVGIDFGSRTIKLLQLRENGRKLRVVGAGSVDVHGGESGPDDTAALTDQLWGAFASGGFSGRRCVISLPRDDVRVQSVRLPKMPDDELQQAAVWEASQRFGFDRAAMEVDIIRTGAELQGGENREEVLLIAASHTAINARLEPLMAAGLRPVAIETHFTALARAFSRPTFSPSAVQEVRAVVDVGVSGSTVMILRGGQIAFCKPIAMGGDLLDRAVAEHLEMDVASARSLRAARIAASCGQTGSVPITDPSIERAEYDAVRPLLGSFAKEVMLCVRYYGVTFRGHPPQHLILTGGDGLEPRLDEVLAEHCKIPVTFEHEGPGGAGLLESIKDCLHRDPGPPACWAVAAGLSLRGVSPARVKKVRPMPPRQEAA